jgi:chromosome segregation ATPase
MSFTVSHFHDLVELLEQNPTWRAELRRLVLTDEILNLPQELRELTQIVRELSETSKRNEARFVRIESDIDVLKTDVAELKTDVAQLKTDVAELKTDVAQLKTDVAQLKTDVAELKTDVAELKTDVAELKTDVAELKSNMAGAQADIAVLKNDVAQLKGSDLEWQVRERPFVYLSRFARRVRVVSDAELGDLIEDAIEQKRLTEAEAEQVKLLDSVARGLHRETDETLYLAAEVSSVVSQYDLDRALARAAMLQKATLVKTQPIIIGKTIHLQMRTKAEAQKAGWVQLPD